MARISGSFLERRPRASSSPSGKHSVMPATARNRLSMMPPQSVTSSGTRRNRMMPPNPSTATSTRNGPERPGRCGPTSRPTTAARTAPMSVSHGPTVVTIDRMSAEPTRSGQSRPAVPRAIRHHGTAGPGGDPPRDDPPPADEPADDAGEARHERDGEGDPPQLVARVAADHEQLQVDPHDLPPTGDEHVADGPVDDVADDDGRHDRDDGVAGRAEQVVADPVGRPGRGRAFRLRRRHGRWCRRRSCSRVARPHRSTIARRRLKRLTISEITSEMPR